MKQKNGLRLLKNTLKKGHKVMIVLLVGIIIAALFPIMGQPLKAEETGSSESVVNTPILQEELTSSSLVTPAPRKIKGTDELTESTKPEKQVETETVSSSENTESEENQIVSFEQDVYEIKAIKGTPKNKLELPKKIKATMSDGSEQEIPVTWEDSGVFDPDTEGDYTFSADFGDAQIIGSAPYAVVMVRKLDQEALPAETAESTTEQKETELSEKISNRAAPTPDYTIDIGNPPATGTGWTFANNTVTFDADSNGKVYQIMGSTTNNCIVISNNIKITLYLDNTQIKPANTSPISIGTNSELSIYVIGTNELAMSQQNTSPLSGTTGATGSKLKIDGDANGLLKISGSNGTQALPGNMSTPLGGDGISVDNLEVSNIELQVAGGQGGHAGFQPQVYPEINRLGGVGGKAINAKKVALFDAGKLIIAGGTGGRGFSSDDKNFGGIGGSGGTGIMSDSLSLSGDILITVTGGKAGNGDIPQFTSASTYPNSKKGAEGGVAIETKEFFMKNLTGKGTFSGGKGGLTANDIFLYYSASGGDGGAGVITDQMLAEDVSAEINFYGGEGEKGLSIGGRSWEQNLSKGGAGGSALITNTLVLKNAENLLFNGGAGGKSGLIGNPTRNNFAATGGQGGAGLECDGEIQISDSSVRVVGGNGAQGGGRNRLEGGEVGAGGPGGVGVISMGSFYCSGNSNVVLCGGPGGIVGEDNKGIKSRSVSGGYGGAGVNCKNISVSDTSEIIVFGGLGGANYTELAMGGEGVLVSSIKFSSTASVQAYSSREGHAIVGTYSNDASATLVHGYFDPLIQMMKDDSTLINVYNHADGELQMMLPANYCSFAFTNHDSTSDVVMTATNQRTNEYLGTLVKTSDKLPPLTPKKELTGVQVELSPDPIFLATPATDITHNSAELNGMFHLMTYRLEEGRFEFGRTTSYGANYSWSTTSTLSGNITPQTVNGLTSNTRYHYRVSGKTTKYSGSWINSNDVSFVTLPLINTITSVPTSGTTATVSGAIDAPTNGEDITDLEVTYATDANFTQNVVTLTGANAGTVKKSSYTANLSGLDEGETYHVRVRVKGPGGWSTYKTSTLTMPSLTWSVNTTAPVFSARDLDLKAIAENTIPGGGIVGDKWFATETTDTKDYSKASDFDAKYTTRITGGAGTAPQGVPKQNIYLPASDNGTYWIKVTFKDAAGNEFPIIKSIKVTNLYTQVTGEYKGVDKANPTHELYKDQIPGLTGNYGIAYELSRPLPGTEVLSIVTDGINPISSTNGQVPAGYDIEVTGKDLTPAWTLDTPKQTVPFTNLDLGTVEFEYIRNALPVTLTITNETTGDYADPKQAFDGMVQLRDDQNQPYPVGTTYDYDLLDATTQNVISTGQVTVSASGEISFKLKHNEMIVIKELDGFGSYNLSSALVSGYDQTLTQTQPTSGSLSDPAKTGWQMFDGKNQAFAFEHIRDLKVESGLTDNPVWPLALTATGVAGVGLAGLVISRRRRGRHE